MLTETKASVSDLGHILYQELKKTPPITARPASTYRLQLHRAFGFRAAQALIPYLHALGLTHVYASPCFRAAPGSPHGYDVYDHGELNPELGSPEDFNDLVSSLRQHGMGLVVDFVSNHIGIGPGNPYWMDVLEGGQASLRAGFFDIDWTPGRPDLVGRVLIPILSEQYGVVLERGELVLKLVADGFELHYFEHRLPLCVNSWHRILAPLAADNEVLDGILQDIRRLPGVGDTDPGQMARRDVLGQSIVERFCDALEAAPVRDLVAASVRQLNGSAGQPASFDDLDALIAEQAYRLADWRVAGEEINYRRFFDINGLAAIRMEDPAVFTQMHRLVLSWIERGLIDGVRIDHPDGLYDPSAYFSQLQEEHVVAAARRMWRERFRCAGDWTEIEPVLREQHRREMQDGRAGSLQRPLYVVVEKILARGEHMPPQWAIDGTTGYEYLNVLNGLFVDGGQLDAVDALYSRFTRHKLHFADLLYRKKKLIMADAMASEMNMLAQRLSRVAHMNRKTRDFTLNSLKRVLVEYIACLGVYRTYVDGRRDGIDERDARYIEEAIGRARRKAPSLDASIFTFLQQVLSLGVASPDAALIFVMKLQQLSGAIMAKGMEDTCFYIYNRLVSLNEVGGEPQRFGNTVWEFHARNRERAQAWPGALSATSTHDTKRSEDVRARINVLSEIPDEWKYHLWLWNRIHLRHRREVHGHLAPDRNEEFFLYQTIIGTWPRSLTFDDTYRERIRNTVRKSLREAKLHTSWMNNDLAYEGAVLAFVDHVLSGNEAFMADMIPFMRRVVMAGLHNAVAQVLLKIASPGVPDIYQGCELWDDSLVDPDNRRPVDFNTRVRMLAEIDTDVAAQDPASYARSLYADLEDPLDDGRLKLFVTARLLRFRRQYPELFRAGRYIPLEATERWREHVCAFARQAGDQMMIAVAPRLVYRMLGPDGLLTPQVWDNTWIPIPGDTRVRRFVDVVTGAEVRSEIHDERACLFVGHVLGHFPVALLQSVED